MPLVFYPSALRGAIRTAPPFSGTKDLFRDSSKKLASRFCLSFRPSWGNLHSIPPFSHQRFAQRCLKKNLASRFFNPSAMVFQAQNNRLGSSALLSPASYDAGFAKHQSNSLVLLVELLGKPWDDLDTPWAHRTSQCSFGAD